MPVTSQNALLVMLPPIDNAQAALERRAHWVKFGDAATERASDCVTAQSVDEVAFERLRPQKQTQDEKNKQQDFQSAMASSDKAVIVGSLRDMLYKKRMERQLLAAKGLIAGPERPPGEEVRRGWGVGRPAAAAAYGRTGQGVEGLAGWADRLLSAVPAWCDPSCGAQGLNHRFIFVLSICLQDDRPSGLPTAGTGRAGGYVPPSLRGKLGMGGEGEAMQVGRRGRKGSTWGREDQYAQRWAKLWQALPGGAVLGPAVELHQPAACCL